MSSPRCYPIPSFTVAINIKYYNVMHKQNSNITHVKCKHQRMRRYKINLECMDEELIQSQDDSDSELTLTDFPVEVLFYIISYLSTRDKV